MLYTYTIILSVIKYIYLHVYISSYKPHELINFITQNNNI